MRGYVDFFFWYIFENRLFTFNFVFVSWLFSKRLKCTRYIKRFQNLTTYDTLLFYSFLKRIKMHPLRKTIPNLVNVRYAFHFFSFLKRIKSIRYVKRFQHAIRIHFFFSIINERIRLLLVVTNLWKSSQFFFLHWKVSFWNQKKNWRNEFKISPEKWSYAS